MVAGMTETNNGRKSARQSLRASHGSSLLPRPQSSGNAGTDGEEGLQQTGSGSFTLPPLTRNARAVEALDNLMGADMMGASSPAKRGRKKSLASYAEGVPRSIIQASLEVDLHEKEMTLARENRREHGRLLLETWVDQVLSPGSSDLSGRTEPMQPNMTTKGLAIFGLTRVELLGAGLSNPAVDRLYRGLYVYTIGFFDIMQDILEHSEFRLEILSNVWRAYLAIAEAALKVAFKSDYLQLFQAQQITAAELLVAKEALTEARQDSFATEKALAWLTAAHSEERALRAAARIETAATAEQLAKERSAHQAAVQRLVAEMEARTRLSLEGDALKSKLVEAASAQTLLVAQRDELQAANDSLEDKCINVMGDVGELYGALVQEDALKVDPARLASVQQAVTSAAECIAGVASAANIAALTAKSSVVRHLVTQLYALWRTEALEHKTSKRDLFTAKDSLRASRAETLQVMNERAAAQKEVVSTSMKLSAITNNEAELQAALDAITLTLEKTENAKLMVGDEAARLTRHVDVLEQQLDDTTNERDGLAAMVERQAQELVELTARAEAVAAELQRSDWVGKQISKGMAVAMRALTCNQIARASVVHNLGDSRAEVTSLVNRVDASNRQIRVQEGKIETLLMEKQELQMALDMSRRLGKIAQDALEASLLKGEDQFASIQNLELSACTLKIKEEELASGLDRVTKLLAVADAGLVVEKEEVTRLYSCMQDLEKQLRMGSEERVRITKRLEQAKTETVSLDEKSKRRESTLALEIKRLQSEVRVEVGRLQAMELQLESSRKDNSEGTDALARKRQKKRTWKKLCLHGISEGEHVRQQLAEARELVAALEARVHPLELELALLVADRGRPMPDIASLSKSLAQLQFAVLQAAAQAAPPKDGLTSPASPRRALSPASTALFTPSGSQAPDKRVSDTSSAALDSKPGSMKNRASGTTTGLYEGLAVPGQLELGDMTAIYRLWDDGHRNALDIQVRLDEHNKVLEAGRKQYERARAVHYTNPTDKTLQDRMAARQKELTEARAERGKMESELEACTSTIRTQQGLIHEYEAAQASSRMEALHKRIGSEEQSLRSELVARLDESEARTREVAALLEAQRTAYGMLLAARNNLEGEATHNVNEMCELSSKLVVMVTDKVEMEDMLRQARSQVMYLQGELTSIIRERETLKGQVLDHEAIRASMRSEVEAAAANIATSLKRAEERLAEEKAAAVAMVHKEKVELTLQMAHKQAIIDDLNYVKKRLQEDMRQVLLVHYNEQEESEKPAFMFCVRPRPVVVSAQALVPDFSRVTNLHLLDPVVHFLAPSYDMLIVIISHLYTTKMMVDLKEEEYILGGRVGPRSDLEAIIYDFFMARYGTRGAAELHISAFLFAVLKYRTQHPKIRVFARLIALEDPLPRHATEFYIALLNRIHSRAGPLVSEASEGQSHVKCKIVAKAARELLRGSFANINDDAANLSDTLRHMAMNDEEQPVDLEIALEMTLKAWWQQYNLDVEAMETALRNFADGRDLTPDDLLHFLKQVDSGKAEALPHVQLLQLYRIAVRRAGPQPTHLEHLHSISHAIITQGFAGMSNYRARLEPVAMLPPYDEFRLLEESWRSMRTVVEFQLNVLDERPELRGDLSAFIAVARRLDLALELRDSPTLPWAHYRRLLAMYLSHRKMVDRVRTFAAPEGAMAPGLLGLPQPSGGADDALVAAELHAAAAKASVAAAANKQAKKVGVIKRRDSFGAQSTYSFGGAHSRGSSLGGQEEPEDTAPLDRKSGGLLRGQAPAAAV